MDNQLKLIKEVEENPVMLMDYIISENKCVLTIFHSVVIGL